MKSVRIWFAVAIAIFLSVTVQADTAHIFPAGSVGLLKEVKLEVGNHVKGGCWTNTEDISEMIRTELEKGEISVTDSVQSCDPRYAKMFIVIYGDKDEEFGNCFATWKGIVHRSDRVQHGGAVIWLRAVLANEGGTASGQSSFVSQTITSEIEKFISKLASDVRRLRQTPTIQEALNNMDRRSRRALRSNEC